ncbi:hypothetical protein [Deminuibacter soli]|uniref:Uncharacterized protein n=1 Tax=Deminuibacter soli TaxID=2291815 RepID=A0A3E1NPC6_9BACT|nr:hypothetical protein [Deminuibacter soli]RFM29638.1 hypothetical protein DXN05_01245 [Deminuibacter soli]
MLLMNANVKLSANEMALVSDAGFILTKLAITGKVYLILGNLCSYFREYTAAHPHAFPEEVLAVSPKIYRGESYRQLPYVMLDYPRYFAGGNAFAIRCLFWWGNSFSIHLHLSGSWKQLYAHGYAALIQSGALDSWYCCIATGEWEHHFGEDNYVLIGTAREVCVQHVYKQHFIKLAQKIPLQEWDHAYDFYREAFATLAAVAEKIKSETENRSDH